MALPAPSQSFTNRSLESQREWLERGGRFQRLHWLVIGASVLFALFAWRYTTSLVEERARAQFERLASHVVDLVHDRLDGYANALRSGAGFVNASERVTLDEWHSYTSTLELRQRFPALRVFGVAYLVPATRQGDFIRVQQRNYPTFNIFPDYDGAVRLPVSLIWPADFEDTIIGFDIAREPSRRETLQRALATGAPQMTERVSLGLSGTPGLILMAPFSRSSSTDAGYEPPKGVSFAAIRASELFNGTSESNGQRIALRLSDQSGTIHENENYQSIGADARFTTEHRFSMFGRDLVFESRSTQAFYEEPMFSLPVIALMAALLIDVLVFTVIYTLIESNRRALYYAAQASQALRRESEELAGANRELSSANTELANLGHVLSHDLRAPLNSIESLVDLAEDDLAEADLSAATRTELVDHLTRMRRQIVRGKTLITGILDYAGLGADDPTSSRVDVREMLVGIGEGLQLGPDRLKLPADLPILQTCSVRLDQVFSNLVGNALKYHPTPANARIRIEAGEHDGMVRFSVDDNGMGIEPQHREKVFELFKTLQSSDTIESSGVGLSIVKKSVEQFGGSVTLEEAESGGARFVFTWPSELRKVA